MVVTGTSTSGNCLVCAIAFDPSISTDTFSVTDSASNTWTQLGGTSRTGINIQVWAAYNASAVTTVTVSWQTGNNAQSMIVQEFSGVASSSASDVTPVTGTGSNATQPSLTITPASANDILIACLGERAGTSTSDTITGDTNFSNSSDVETTGTTSTGVHLRMESRLVTTATSYTWSASDSPDENWVALIAALKPSGSAAYTDSATVTEVAVVSDADVAGFVDAATAITVDVISSSETYTTSGSSQALTGVGFKDEAFGQATISADSTPVLTNIGSVSQNSTSNKCTVLLSGSAAVGDLILIGIGSSSIARVISSVADSKGQTYNLDVIENTSTSSVTSFIASLRSASALTGGTDTITVTFSNSVFSQVVVSVNKVTNMATSPLDQTAHAKGNTTVADTGATGTTTQANEIAFATMCVLAASTFTPAAGWTEITDVTAGSNHGVEVMYKKLSATGTVDASATMDIGGSNPWSAAVATYKVGTFVAPHTALGIGWKDESFGQATLHAGAVALTGVGFKDEKFGTAVIATPGQVSITAVAATGVKTNPAPYVIITMLHDMYAYGWTDETWGVATIGPAHISSKLRFVSEYRPDAQRLEYVPIAARVISGAPTDASPDGTLVVDEANGILYARLNGVWVGSTLS